jgi:hypothetical protein
MVHCIVIALPKPFRCRGLSRSHPGFFVSLSSHHHRPDHPGHLVGQRDRRDLGRAASQQMHQPGAPRPMPLGVADDSQSPSHQELPQIAVALLGDAAQLFLALLEFCRGTSPIQAARSLPDLKAVGSGTVATMALASTGPTPGISISRWPSSVDLALARTSRSFSRTWSFTNRS